MIYILESYFRENLAYVLQMCQIAPFLIFSKGARPWIHIANVQLYYHSLFYYKLNSMKQSFRNTSELTKLSHCQIFLVEDARNSLTKPVVAKLLFLFLYLYNIICENFLQKIYASILQNALSYSVFYNVFGWLCSYACAFVFRSYGPKHLPIPVTNLVYTPGYDHIWCFYLISKFVFK